ncbi:hypothetical protein [Allopontixanthobacter sediminis]|uniref:Uncharacterized protein n=1 Tax=Allopontixanthobacter sediminis TaxID=1689985 RepID=A0A845B3A5_9SPHN|nr:hypothetical protein [Allopontixanthobacter sediminis]MXP44676.1 hypothetical protein [Allopontixanthobacter sediminis]
MTQYQKALLLSGAMIAVAVLAIFDFVPEEFAQYGPVALLAIFPSAWLGKNRTCRVKQ